ncbi:hypothetical protein JXA84_06390 [candidate division WOR-3 bacterium]|nr:hypothetical protein [candidate division WOR-3 bacterium]
MPRTVRLELPKSLYLVEARGNRNLPIFCEEEEKNRFLTKLAEYKEKYDFSLYAYSLRDESFQLLLETGLVPLSRVMQGVMQSFTQWVNKKHKTSGHLFGSRYKSILCDKNSFFTDLISYVNSCGENNGKKQFCLSSKGEYLSAEKRLLVDFDKILKYLNCGEEELVARINRVPTESFRVKLEKSRQIFGGDGFFENVKYSSGKKNAVERQKDKTLEETAQMTEKLTGIDKEALLGSRRRKDIVRARALFVKLSLFFTKSKKKEIAFYLDRVPRNIPYLERKISETKFEEYLRRL